MKLPRSFYARKADLVAKDLLGTILVHRLKKKMYRARIVETEAYLGQKDLACHASKGRTKRTEVMFGPPGYAYVYFVYGMYDMFNIVTAEEGDPHAVLIRAAEPLDGWKINLSGPGKLTKAMKINRRYNGTDLCGPLLYVEEGRPITHITKTPRIGVHYAGAWSKRSLRFFDSLSLFVSKRSSN